MTTDLPADNLYLGRRAANYDAAREHNPVTAEDDAAIRRFLSGFANGSVIGDAPCGTGRALNPVLNEGLVYFGIDISPDMLNICRSKIPPGQKARLDLADARHIPWDTGSCNGLLSVKFLKWLPDNEVVLAVLKEYRRVCQGQAFINLKLKDEVRVYSFVEIIDRVRKVFDKLRMGVSARSIRRKEFEVLLAEADWKIVRVEKNAASNGVVFNYIVE